MRYHHTKHPWGMCLQDGLVSNKNSPIHYVVICNDGDLALSVICEIIHAHYEAYETSTPSRPWPRPPLK